MPLEVKIGKQSNHPESEFIGNSLLEDLQKAENSQQRFLGLARKKVKEHEGTLEVGYLRIGDKVSEVCIGVRRDKKLVGYITLEGSHSLPLFHTLNKGFQLGTRYDRGPTIEITRRW